ncbi:hypothetical protein BDW22DRAFT_961890 [Trametopsis cervina]|nr:hypothetical protein BDW22DRAFT_961890 [Trametopsis cervina]
MISLLEATTESQHARGCALQVTYTAWAAGHHAGPNNLSMLSCLGTPQFVLFCVAGPYHAVLLRSYAIVKSTGIGRTLATILYRGSTGISQQCLLCGFPAAIVSCSAEAMLLCHDPDPRPLTPLAAHRMHCMAVLLSSINLVCLRPNRRASSSFYAKEQYRIPLLWRRVCVN